MLTIYPVFAVEGKRVEDGFEHGTFYVFLKNREWNFLQVGGSSSATAHFELNMHIYWTVSMFPLCKNQDYPSSFPILKYTGAAKKCQEQCLHLGGEGICFSLKL